MEVVHISTSDIEGGSARSAWRIHQNILAYGLASKMLVGTKSSGSLDVDQIANTEWMRRADHFVNRVGLKLGLQYCYLPSSRQVAGHPWLTKASVVQLYNLHGGYFDLSTLRQLSKKSAIVWRLSDLWPITGHCAYPGNCTKWQTGCNKCPDLGTYPGIGIDTTPFLWGRKKKIYSSIKPFTVVAPSSWTENAAASSPLFEGCDIVRIPNGINTKTFSQIDRMYAREKLGIFDNRPAILFCAHVAFNNERKGTGFLKKVLNSLPDDNKYCFIVAGKESEKWINQIPIKTHSLGFVECDDTLANLYAAADIVVIPSSVENLPNTAIEALACSRPVVAMDAGGMSDVVRDGETGYCSPVGDVDHFIKNLRALLENDDLRKSMGHAGRMLIEKEFDQYVEAERFVRLYESVIK
ncbi:MAG: glycosyltransferase family 4 protein [Pseudomonadota bacterium]|nr:glycosyltransferase family 4 protein [Pseudomonadota bacterium]